MDEFEDEEENPDKENPAAWVTKAYLDSVPVRKCAGERRRIWAALLYTTTSGFPGSKGELQKIDDLVRYLEGGFTGPRPAEK